MRSRQRSSEVGATVRGTRCYLRPLSKRDEREWVALRSSSREHLKPFEPRPPVGTDPFGPGSFRSQLDRARSAANDLSLILSRDNDRILGGVNLSQIVMGPFRSAYLGYWIGRPYLRQGFMTEALQLALRRAFRTHGLHRVEANILTHNTASRALVKRAGFRREGLSPRYLKIAGRWQDHERWALLEEEWVPVGRTYLVPTT